MCHRVLFSFVESPENVPGSFGLSCCWHKGRSVKDYGAPCHFFFLRPIDGPSGDFHGQVSFGDGFDEILMCCMTLLGSFEVSLASSWHSACSPWLEDLRSADAPSCRSNTGFTRRQLASYSEPASQQDKHTERRRGNTTGMR